MKLIAEGGLLYYDRTQLHDEQQRQWFPDSNPILLVIYDAGDCDTIHWPDPNKDHLRRALYDGRECGYTGPRDTEVTLPDDTTFYF